MMQRTVFVVDDDPEMRESLNLMLRSRGLRVVAFGSAEEFLDSNFESNIGPKCLILDIRMPGMSGLGLQEILAQKDIHIPILFLTGVGDVATAVQALRGGAVDFVQKPLHRQALLERVERALDIDAQTIAAGERHAEYRARLDSLSEREREVFDLLIQGKNSKEIAAHMGIGIPTVTKHRTRVFQKMKVRNAVELVKLTSTFPN